MSVSQSAFFNPQEFADAGTPLVSGRLYTYAYGTTTQKVAYTDAAGAVPHTYTSDGAGGLYIALNSRGELPAPLYLLTDSSYDLALKRADGSSVWTRRADGVGVVADTLRADLAASGGSALVSFLQAGTGAVTRTAQDKGREIISAADFGISSANTSAVNTALLQGAIDYFSGLARQFVIQFRGLTGTVKFAKQSGQTYAIKLKRGVCLEGGISGFPDTQGVNLMLDTGQNCDFIVIDGGSSAQHYGIRGILLDGNKANNPTGGHLIRALSLDYANCVEFLKLQNAKGAGLYMDNSTYVNAGNVRLSNIDAVRCDGAGVYMLGAADTLLMENVMCEGNGLDGTAGSAGANYVFENGTDSTFILMLSCRAEARTLVNGGAIYNILLKNMSGGTIQCDAGFIQGVSGNIRTADFAITGSTARILVNAGRVQSTTGAPTVVIDDQFAGRQVLRADIDFRTRGLQYNCFPMLVPDTGSGILEKFGDKASNYATRTASTSAPEGSVSALPGSVHYRTDSGTGGTGQAYVKRSVAVAQTADTAGWWQMVIRKTQAVAFSASITPDITQGNIMNFDALTGNTAINVATGSADGDYMEHRFTQDGTGAWTPTYNASYKIRPAQPSSKGPESEARSHQRGSQGSASSRRSGCDRADPQSMGCSGNARLHRDSGALPAAQVVARRTGGKAMKRDDAGPVRCVRVDHLQRRPREPVEGWHLPPEGWPSFDAAAQVQCGRHRRLRGRVAEVDQPGIFGVHRAAAAPAGGAGAVPG
jgi:hypothetical protein